MYIYIFICNFTAKVREAANKKILYLFKYICKMYTLGWQIFNEIVDNQNLYRNKDDFCIFFKQKILNL